MKLNLKFRPACADDFLFLLSLRRQTMNPHLHNAGLLQNKEAHIERIRYRFDCAAIIICDSTAIGLLKVVREGPVWELVQLQLNPSYQSMGIGGSIIKQILKEAFAQGAAVKLSVFKVNPAKNLYEKLGFKIYSETAATYEMQAAKVSTSLESCQRIKEWYD